MMIATKSVVVKKQLKITFSGRRVEAEPLERFASNLDGWNANSSSGNDHNGESGMHSSNMAGEMKTEIKFSVPIGNKRGSTVESGVPCKKLKLDRNALQQCSSVLKRLMQHQCGWPFLKPVDPAALNIPDYFSVISHPMDLGTIKSKLEKNFYGGAEEFAADVRLTFSNAMLYNPPGNFVHKMADKLNKMFETGWKSRETKWNSEARKFAGAAPSDRKIKDNSIPGQNEPKTPPLQTTLPKNRTLIVAKIKNVPSGELGKVPVQENSTPKSFGDNDQGINDKNARCLRCDMGGGTSCKCTRTPLNGLNLSVAVDLPFERANIGANGPAVVPSLVRKSSMSCASKGDQDSDGTLSGDDEESVCPISHSKASTTETEDWGSPSLDVQLSPKKALRAAMLKSRFADTILKAKHKTLLSDKADPVKIQLEKERLEQQQHEEKARIEAQIRAAEVAARMRVEAELKDKRERDRVAARIALQKMEKTVDVGENLETLKELEMLSGCSLSFCLRDSDDGSSVLSSVCDGVSSGNALERLGLFMKDDYPEDDEEETIVSGEEGEICQ